MLRMGSWVVLYYRSPKLLNPYPVSLYVLEFLTNLHPGDMDTSSPVLGGASQANATGLGFRF